MRGTSLARVAVVQLDFYPAAVLHNLALIEDPLGAAVGTVDVPPALDDSARELKARIRSAYLESLWIKVSAILDACANLDVGLVVFPEYSIPWEL